VLLDDPRNILLDNTNPKRTRERLELTQVDYSTSQELTAGVCSCVVVVVAQGNQGRPPHLRAVGPLVPTLRARENRRCWEQS